MEAISSIALEKSPRRKKKVLKNRKSRSLSKVHILDDGLPYFSLDYKRLKKLKADNYNSVYLGKCKIRNATRRQKFRKPNLNCSIKFNKHKEVFDEFGIDVDKCVIIDGCYDTNCHTIQRQMIPETTGKFSEYPTRGNVDDLLPSIRVVLRKLKRIGILNKCTFDDVFETEISVDKKPGMRFEECYKMRTKKEAIKTALKISEKRWEYLEKNFFRGVR